MDFYAVLDEIRALLQRRERVTYRVLKVQFQLDDERLEALKEELIEAEQLAVDEQGRVLVWAGAPASTSPLAFFPGTDPERAPLSYTPQYLAEKVLTSRSALEGERKQVTVRFADLKDSTEVMKDLGLEAAQQLLVPALLCIIPGRVDHRRCPVADNA